MSYIHIVPTLIVSKTLMTTGLCYTRNMNEELTKAMQKVVDYLDDEMTKTPSRELADTSNYLQAILDENK